MVGVGELGFVDDEADVGLLVLDGGDDLFVGDFD